MAYTITSGTGSSVAAGTQPTPAYPSAGGMGAGKLAILHGFIKNDINGSLSAPSGWVQRSDSGGSSDDRSTVWSRELDGTETAGGTIAMVSTGSSGRRGVMVYTIDTAGGSGWNFEDIDLETGGGGSTTINDNNVTTGGNGRLALNIITYGQRQTVGQENFVGESGGSWVASGYFEGGNTPTMSLQTAELVSAATVGGGSDTSITAAAWFNHGASVWRNPVAGNQPDLVVDDILVNVAQLAVGEPATFSANIHNVGTAPTPAVAHRVSFAVSGVNVAFSTSWTTALVKVSGSAVVVADGSWTPTVAGSTAVVAFVDDLSQIAESNEANNTLSKQFTPINRPNLRIADILWTPVSSNVGDAVTFSAVIENAGLGVSPTTVHAVEFDVGGNQVATATGQITSIAVSALVTATADGFWNPSTAGTFSVVATIDPNNIIKEFSEADNSRSENITIGVGAGAVTSFNGRGGAVMPIISDYDQFFLTPTEGDDLFLTPAEGDARYLQQVSADARYIQFVSANALFIDQTEANAQGMPAIEAGAVGSGLEISEVNANFTLIAPSSPRYYWQNYFNTGAATITVSPPSGHTIVGSNTISTLQSALFVKRAGVAQFRRWS